MTRALFVAASLLYASACASLPETHFYRLVPARANSAPQPIAGMLAIQPLESDAVYASDQIVYRTGPTRVDYYNYHRWIAPPAAQLTDYLRDALMRSGLFRGVQSRLDSSAQAALSGRVIAFEEVDVSPTEWQGQLELLLSLEDVRSGDAFWSKRYARSEPITRRDPEGLAVALSVAMQHVVDASVPEIANAMRGRSVAAE